MSAIERQDAPLTFPDHYGHYYQIVIHGEVPHPLAKQFNPYCLDAIARFLRRDLCVSSSQWSSLLLRHSLERRSFLAKDLHQQVAALIYRQRIRLYKLPSLNSFRAIRSTKARSLHFVKGLSLPATSQQKPINFVNEADVDLLLASLNADAAVWQEILAGQSISAADTYAPAGADIDLIEEVKQQILNGDIVVYEGPRTDRKPKSGSPEVEYAAGPSARAVPLAPETTTSWIEIKLLYDDDSPIAEQQYWIQDADGVEHTGTTSAKGIAKINSMAPGMCTIKFPELDGWY